MIDGPYPLATLEVPNSALQGIESIWCELKAESVETEDPELYQILKDEMVIYEERYRAIHNEWNLFEGE